MVGLNSFQSVAGTLLLRQLSGRIVRKTLYKQRQHTTKLTTIHGFLGCCVV